MKKKQPVLFLGVGVINTLIDFGFYSFLTSAVFTAKEQIALAGFLSGTVALLCAFATHAFITFKGSHISVKTLLKFSIFTGFGMWVIRPALLAVFINLDGLYSWAYKASETAGIVLGRDFVANTGAFGLMVVLLLLYNYYVYSKFVFKRPISRTDQENHSAS